MGKMTSTTVQHEMHDQNTHRLLPCSAPLTSNCGLKHSCSFNKETNLWIKSTWHLPSIEPIHCHASKTPSPDQTLSQLIIPHIMLLSHLELRLSSGTFPSGLLIKIVCAFLSLSHTTFCSADFAPQLTKHSLFCQHTESSTMHLIYAYLSEMTFFVSPTSYTKGSRIKSAHLVTLELKPAQFTHTDK
jgi:hypothetical protein